MATASPTRNSRAQTRSYQRWTAVLICVIVAELGAAVWIEETTRGSELVTTGLPVGAILTGAAIFGILVSLVVFRAPHDGQTEL